MSNYLTTFKKRNLQTKTTIRFVCFFILSLLTVTPSLGQNNFSEIFRNVFEVYNEKSKKSYFKGQIQKGKRNGMGLLKQPNGNIYCGDFYYNKMTGYGMLLAGEHESISYCDSCVVYIGNWKDGKKSGLGTCYASNGDILYEGNFNDDRPSDKYPSDSTCLSKYFSFIKDENGTAFLGETKIGNADGLGVLIYSNGDLWLSNFRNGNRHGVGLYLLHNGEWETLNFGKGDPQKISSSENYRKIDAERKAAFRSALSESINYFAEAAQKVTQISQGAKALKNDNISNSNTTILQENSSQEINLTRSSRETSNSSPYSLSANQSKNTDSRTYGNYDGMLAKMRAGLTEYNNSKRLEYQSKMRKLRQKWEARGERFQHSENEDWSGK